MPVTGLATSSSQRGMNYATSTVKHAIWAFGAILAFGLSGCNTETETPSPNPTFTTEFNKGADSWTTGLVDYNEQQEGIMEFSSKIAALPTDTTKKAYMIQSHNRSDDAFMYLTRKYTGLTPNQTYKINFEVELASKYPQNSVGIGGSPGGAVYLKAGASGTEPQRSKDNTGQWKLNWDKGAQSEGGKEAVLLGTIGIEGSDDTKYQLIKRTNSQTAFTAKTNDKGELWLLVGTDSGFEGLTTLYYTQIKALLTKQ